MTESWMSGDARQVAPGEFPGIERAHDLVAADVSRTWTGDKPGLTLLLFADSPAGSRVQPAIRGWGWQCAGISAEDLPGTGQDPVAAVADAVQENVIEWAMRAWPVCSDHQLGLHVVSDDIGPSHDEWMLTGPASWWCSANGGHRIAAIGQLLHPHR